MRNTFHKRGPFAKKYVLCRVGGDGHPKLYRNGNPLKAVEKSGKLYNNIYCDDGVRRFVNLTQLADNIFGDGERPVLTEDMILNKLDARPIPGWSRYAITSYGAIYCVHPPRRGFNAHGCYLVTEREKGGAMYVTLYDHGMKRKTLKVDDLLRSTWNY